MERDNNKNILCFFDMAQSLALALVHIIFYTKNRSSFLQEIHHHKMTFQDEFRALINKHEVRFDERYVWD
jgi:hypothetical protein